MSSRPEHQASSKTRGRGDRSPSAARDRVVAAAYELFSRHGIRAVGVDAVVARSGVAKMTLYRHFASKDELVLEFLREREARWTVEWLQGEVEARTDDPAQRLLAVFDVFDGWFRRDDFEGCAFINVLLETADAESPIAPGERRSPGQHPRLPRCAGGGGGRARPRRAGPRAGTS